MEADGEMIHEAGATGDFTSYQDKKEQRERHEMYAPPEREYRDGAVEMETPRVG